MQSRLTDHDPALNALPGAYADWRRSTARMIADLQISPAVVNIPDGTLVHMLGNPDGPENERLKTGICPLTADGGSTLSPMTRAAIYARYGTIQRKRKTRSKTKTQVIATTA